MEIQTLLERTHYAVLFWSTAAAIATGLLGWWLGRRLTKVPGRRQCAAELLVSNLSSACREAHGPRCSRVCIALFGTLVLFAIVSNVLGVVPLRHVGLGLIPAGGIEFGGEEFRDFSGDGVWQPGEPVVRNSILDWQARDRGNGFLIPSVYGRTTGANILLELSLGLVVAAGLLLGMPLWFRLVVADMKQRRWHAIIRSALLCGVKAFGRSVALWASPLSGALPAIAAGVILYNVFLMTDVTFMTNMAAGLLELVIVATVFGHRRSKEPDVRRGIAGTPVSATMGQAT